MNATDVDERVSRIHGQINDRFDTLESKLDTLAETVTKHCAWEEGRNAAIRWLNRGLGAAILVGLGAFCSWIAKRF